MLTKGLIVRRLAIKYTDILLGSRMLSSLMPQLEKKEQLPKAYVVVYYFPYLVGHISLKIYNEQNQLSAYYSFGGRHSFAADVEYYGKPVAIKLPLQDRSLIENAKEKFDPHKGYSYLKNNCADQVLLFLKNAKYLPDIENTSGLVLPSYVMQRVFKLQRDTVHNERQVLSQKSEEQKKSEVESKIDIILTLIANDLDQEEYFEKLAAYNKNAREKQAYQNHRAQLEKIFELLAKKKDSEAFNHLLDFIQRMQERGRPRRYYEPYLKLMPAAEKKEKFLKELAKKINEQAIFGLSSGMQEIKLILEKKDDVHVLFRRVYRKLSENKDNLSRHYYQKYRHDVKKIEESYTTPLVSPLPVEHKAKLHEAFNNLDAKKLSQKQNKSDKPNDYVNHYCKQLSVIHYTAKDYRTINQGLRFIAEQDIKKSSLEEFKNLTFKLNAAKEAYNRQEKYNDAFKLIKSITIDNLQWWSDQRKFGMFGGVRVVELNGDNSVKHSLTRGLPEHIADSVVKIANHGKMNNLIDLQEVIRKVQHSAYLALNKNIRSKKPFSRNPATHDFYIALAAHYDPIHPDLSAVEAENIVIRLKGWLDKHAPHLLSVQVRTQPGIGTFTK